MGEAITLENKQILGILLILAAGLCVYLLFAVRYHKHYRQILIAAVTFFPGLYFFLEFLLPKKIAWFQFGHFHDQISRAVLLVGTMAIGLGVINILRVHGVAILKNRKGWGNSLALIFGLLVMFIVEGGDFVNSEKSLASWKRISHLEAFSKRIYQDFRDLGTEGSKRVALLLDSLEQIVAEAERGEGFLSTKSQSKEYAYAIGLFRESIDQARIKGKLLHESYSASSQTSEDRISIETNHRELEALLKQATDGARELARLNYEHTDVRKSAHFLEYAFFFPLGAAMFSLLAFYIATAAYRSFRVRSLEALIMMIAAVVVMLGQIPHGPLYLWNDLPQVRLWLLENLSTPAFRAIYFGAAVAGLAWAVRMWLSLERSPLAEDDL